VGVEADFIGAFEEADQMFLELLDIVMEEVWTFAKAPFEGSGGLDGLLFRELVGELEFLGNLGDRERGTFLFCMGFEIHQLKGRRLGLLV